MIDKREVKAGFSYMRPCGPESTGNLERLLDLSPGVLFRQRTDFSFEYLGAKIEEWSGLPADEWLQKPNLLRDLVHEADAAALKEHLAKCARAVSEAQITFRMRNRKTGRITYVAESRRAVRDSAGTLCGFEGVWTDVSMQVLAARQLDTAAWQATFGLVTLGAVHDLNNKLTGILSLSDLYLADTDKAHPLREGLSMIKQSAQQASQLLHQLAALHQARAGGREYVDLNQFVTVAVELLRRVISSRINIETVLHKEPLAVTIDRVLLQQMVIGWALHAAERMPKGGKLRLETRRAADGKGSATLVISDTGREFVAPAPLAERGRLIVRETSEAAMHDQLGEFAHGHGGSSRVDSQPSGTRVEIILPQATFIDQPAGNGKPWVLLVGKVPDELNQLAGELERRGLAAVIASEPLEEQLNPNWFNWDAVLIQATVAAVPQLLEPVRTRKLPVKIIVYVAGGDVAELEPWVASAAELVTPADLPRERVAEKIARLLM